MKLFAYQVLATYIITRVITGGSILESFRKLLISKTKFLQIAGHKHFIECRLCVTFWISLALTLWFSSIIDTFPVYGLAYFMATQER